MLHNSRRLNAIARISQEVHFNPGASARFLQSATGYSDTTISQILKRMEFERITIPLSYVCGSWSPCLYVLSKLGASKWIGRYRDPLTISQAVTMSHFRLSIFRYFLAPYLESGVAEWIISPWRPKRSTRFASALMCFRDEKIGGHLKLLYFASYLDTAEDIRGAVEGWLKAIVEDPMLSKLPLEIMIVAPASLLPELGLYFRSIFSFADRVVSIAFPQDYPEDWIADREICNRPDSWGHVAKLGALPPALMPRSNFDFEVRLTPYRHSMTVRDHLRRSDKSEAKACGQFVEANRPDMYLLDLIARFPGWKSMEYRELVRNERQSEKFDREFGARFKRVWDAGWLQLIPRAKDRYVLSDAGLEVLAAVEGKPVKDLQKCLGKTNQLSFFESQGAHLESTRRVARLLGFLAWTRAWMYLRTRFTCENIQFARSRSAIKQVVIEPDSIVRMMRNDRDFSLYLEVDRGTRNGKDLEGQLRKYMQMPFAARRPCLLGPVLYVIDAGTESAARMDLIGRKIRSLFKEQYYSSRTHFFLTTLEDLLRNESKVWSSPVAIYDVFCLDGPREGLTLSTGLDGWIEALRGGQ